MLDKIFLQILDMSYTASYVIVFILLARLVLKKAPKSFSYALWSVALFRLICPWSFESRLSLLSAGGQTTGPLPVLPNPQAVLGTAGNAVDRINSLDINGGGIFSSASSIPSIAKEPMVSNILTLVWLAGVAALLIYSVFTFVRLRKQLRGAVNENDRKNVYLSAQLTTPFVMGIIHPKIYLPQFLNETERSYILLHEEIHIRRFDHLIKLVSFFVLCLHWFNPLVWLAFFVSGKDMEMSCDEAVIKKLGDSIKKEYSASLLSLSTGRRIIGAAPLAFGEGDAKSRIKNILNYRKPAFWTLALGIIGAAALCIGLAFNPKSPQMPSEEMVINSRDQQKTDVIPVEENSGQQAEGNSDNFDIEAGGEREYLAPLEAAITKAILGREKNSFGSDFVCESHVTLATKTHGPADGGDMESGFTIYAMVLVQGYNYSKEGLTNTFGSHIPTALTFEVSKSGEYILKDYWIPRDGSYYMKDIKKEFPPEIYEEARDTQKYILVQIQNCYAQAIRHQSFDTAPVIDRLFKELMASYTASSNPGSYVDLDYLTYRELLYYGDYTLRYIAAEFLKGSQTGLKGSLMRIVMNDLLGDEAIEIDADNGQEYFDAWRKEAQEKYMKEKLSSLQEESMQENYPKSYFMLMVIFELEYNK